MNKTWAFALSSLMLLASAGAHAREVYGDVGTEGVGIGYTESFGSRSNVRIEVNGFRLSHSFSAGDIKYDGTARLIHAGIYGDFFPAPSYIPFRLTTGFLAGGDEIDATATSANNFGYSASRLPPGMSLPSGSIHATARFPAVRPYIGFGFGHSPLAKRGFSASFDAGVAFGRPSYSYSVPAGLEELAGPKVVDQEEQELANKLNKLRVYPIVKVGVTYRF